MSNVEVTINPFLTAAPLRSVGVTCGDYDSPDSVTLRRKFVKLDGPFTMGAGS
jgi:hypothetical protein